MQSRQRDVYNAVKAELEENGIPFTLEGAKKHDKFLFTVNGKPFQYVIGRSPSCGYAPMNARADVRRMIRKAKANA